MTIAGSVLFASGDTGTYPAYVEPMFMGGAMTGSLAVVLQNSDFGPPVGGTVLPLFFNVMGSGSDVENTTLSSFIGTGMIGVDVDATVIIPFTEPQIALGLTTVSGTASLTYNSTPIPEPASAALFAVGSLVVGAVLRKRMLA